MVYEYAAVHLDPRVAVSLRLPAHIAKAVQAYADARHISKTDAYVVFLERGLRTPDEESPGGTVDQAAAYLRKALSILESGGVPLCYGAFGGGGGAALDGGLGGGEASDGSGGDVGRDGGLEIGGDAELDGALGGGGGAALDGGLESGEFSEDSGGAL